MPKNNVRVVFLVNYDPAKDAISITADSLTEKELADGGFWLPLRAGTPSETLLRKKLIASGAIKSKSTALSLGQLVKANALAETDKTLLQLLARDQRGVLINGAAAHATAVAAAYLAAARSPRVVVLDTHVEILSLEERFEDILPKESAVYLSSRGKNSALTSVELMHNALRMRPNFIVLSRYEEQAALLESTPATYGVGFAPVYLDDREGMGDGSIAGAPDEQLVWDMLAAEGAKKAGCDAIIQVVRDQDVEFGFAISKVSLI